MKTKRVIKKEVTREDLEREAKELGIQFDSSLSDVGLMLRIAQWYAVKALKGWEWK